MAQIAWASVGVLVLMSAVMAAGWAVQRRADDSGWVDVFWTFGTGLCGVLVALWPTSEGVAFRQLLVASMAAVWSLRLGLYVAFRVAKGREDARYTRLREAWDETYQRRLFWFTQAQAPASGLLCISIALAAHQATPHWRWSDGLGLAILVGAVVGESIADAQLAAFRADPANRGRINDLGLWAWSRHPNYFFEWIGWLAYPVIAVDPGRPLNWLSIAGPALMYLVLTRFTGAPYLEAHMAQSRGPAWADYAGRTPAFFPRPPRGRNRRASS